MPQDQHPHPLGSPLVADALAAIRTREEAMRHLWEMTPAEREAAMWRGDLSFDQCCAWARRAPHEVPLINGEFAFIAVTTPEVAEVEEPPRR